MRLWRNPIVAVACDARRYFDELLAVLLDAVRQKSCRFRDWFNLVDHGSEDSAVNITEEFLRRFKKGDLVDVRTRNTWTGPHELLVYKLDPPKNGSKPAAYMEIEIDGKKLERWLIEGDQQVLRKHVPLKT